MQDAQQAGDERRRMSAATHNCYVQVWVSFGHWLTGKRMIGKRANMNGDKRILSNPFDGMGKLDEQADRRRKARALTEDELVRLLNAAKRRPFQDALMIRRGKRKGELAANVTPNRQQTLERVGFERALIYKVAILTGLRLNELRTLNVSDLSFGDLPFVKLRRSAEKNRKGSTVALRSDLAVDLRTWTAGKLPSDLVFDVPTGLLRILDRDLQAAGIADTTFAMKEWSNRKWTHTAGKRLRSDRAEMQQRRGWRQSQPQIR